MLGAGVSLAPKSRKKLSIETKILYNESKLTENEMIQLLH